MPQGVNVPGICDANLGAEGRSAAVTPGWAKRVHNRITGHPTAVFYTLFSVTVMLLWPHVLSWNYAILCLNMGMVCISVSRFFGVKHGFFMSEIGGLIFFVVQGVFFASVLPSDRVAAADGFLYSFDLVNFGPNSDVVLAKLFDLFPVICLAGKIFYCALPLGIVLVYLALPSYELRKRCSLMFAMTAVFLSVLMPICPGAGPKYFFGAEFPYHAPLQIVPHESIIPGVPLNTTPSGHLAWALLIFWVARQYCGTYSQFNAAVLLMFTVLATMGLGEHYVIDLIVAVPLAVGIWEMTRRGWREAAIALAIVVAWSWALRNGWALQLPRTLAWLACAATVMTPCYLRRDEITGIRNGRQILSNLPPVTLWLLKGWESLTASPTSTNDPPNDVSQAPTP